LIGVRSNTVINVGIGNSQTDTLIADSSPGHNDVLFGGAGNDSFTAGAGEDIFIGGGGIDTAIFHDPEADYSISNLGSGVIVVTDNAADPTDGTVVLDGSFTSLQFADQTVAEAANVRPSGLTTVVSAPETIIAADQGAIDYLLNKGTVSSIAETDQGTGTYTNADVNGWFQTIDGLPATTAPVTSTDLNAYVAQLNSTPPTATPAQVQAQLENPALFYRTSVADFVVREFQAAWGMVPTSTQYDNWVARIIADPALENGGMSLALAGTAEFQSEYGLTSATEPATGGFVSALCANLFGVAPGPGALLNVGLPVSEVLQNFAQSSLFIAKMDEPTVSFQNTLLGSDAVPSPLPSTHMT
jgi:hypothetical protein